MRRHLSYANVVATLALVFAMTGGAIAAKHYLINSTSQINPKVLKKLRGANGKAGPAGQTGQAGKEGAPGKVGAAGKDGERGPAEAFTAQATSVGFPIATGAAEVVAEKNLGVGDYTFVGTVMPHNESAAATEAECVLLEQPSGGGGTNVFDETLTTLEAKGKAGARHGLALSGALALAHEARVSIACKTPSTEGKYEAAWLTATEVGSLG